MPKYRKDSDGRYVLDADGNRIRDYKAEHASIDRLAKSRGYESRRAQRVAREVGAPLPTDTGVQPAKRRVIRAGGLVIVRVSRSSMRSFVTRVAKLPGGTRVDLAGDFDTSSGLRHISAASTTAADLLNPPDWDGGDDDDEYLDAVWDYIVSLLVDAAEEEYGGDWSGGEPENVQASWRDN